MATTAKLVKFERCTQEQLDYYVDFCNRNPMFQRGKNNKRESKMMQKYWEELAEGMNSLRGPTKTTAKSVKFERCTQEQLNYYVDFCNRNPMFQCGKNNKQEPKMMQKYWEELAEGMNSLRGPTRTMEKWKKTLANWKNQLRTRDRKIKMKQKTTGGGRSSIQRLTKFEKQALSVFGSVGVKGNAPTKSTPPSPSPDISLTTSPNITAPPSPSPSPSTSVSLSSTPEATPKASSSSSSRKWKLSTEDMFFLFMNKLDKREEREEEMLKALQGINESLAEILKQKKKSKK